MMAEWMNIVYSLKFLFKELANVLSRVKVRTQIVLLNFYEPKVKVEGVNDVRLRSTCDKKSKRVGKMREDEVRDQQ
jgi:hypothetical protein